jgi:hypothetical protein
MKQLELTFFKLHNKLSSAQPTLKEASLFPILCTIQCFFFKFTQKISNKTKRSSDDQLYYKR